MSQSARPASAGAAASDSNASGTGTVRPNGIACLALVEVVIGLVGLGVARDFASSAGWRFSYDDLGWGMLDGVLAVTYLAASIAGFVLASRIWSMRQDAWQPTVLLSVVLIGLDLFDIFVWGIAGLDLLGIVVHLSLICYLNLSHVRASFGLQPQTFWQGAS